LILTGLFDNNPAAQAAFHGGIAPFVVALVVALALARTRYAWLAVVAGYVTQVALTTGFAFTPLTASRRILLLALAAPVLGIAAQMLPARGRAVAYGLAVLAGLATLWVFAGVLQQRSGAGAWLAAVGLVAFAALMVALVLSLKEDPLRAGAAGVGLGIATGIVALMSASVGFMTAGISIAAGSGALLLVNVFRKEPSAPGLIGTLAIGATIALFAEGALMLAQLPWYALAALLLIPLAVRLPVSESRATIVRATVLVCYALAAAVVPVAAVWIAPGP
jgi:hypothetical protein